MGKIQSKSFILIMTLMFSWQGFCAEEDPVEDTWEEKFIKSDIYIADWFDGMAEGIDLFLAGQKLTKKRNESSVRVENSTFSKEREPIDNSTALNVNLRLPNVEEYWQLKFTSYDDSKERGVQQNYLRKTPRERNYGASVGLFQKLGNIRTAFQPRLALQDPLKISHSLTLESIADLTTYEVNPKLELFADPDKGTGIFQAINIHFALSKTYSLTLINEGEYDDLPHTYSVSNGVSVGQAVTHQTSLSYSFFFNSINQPSYHLAEYNLSVSLNHLLYKKILDYQVTPHLDFVKEQGFVGVPGITFNLNLNF